MAETKMEHSDEVQIPNRFFPAVGISLQLSVIKALSLPGIAASGVQSLINPVGVLPGTTCIIKGDFILWKQTVELKYSVSSNNM